MRARARGTLLRAMLARLRDMDPRRADLLLAVAFYVEALGELFLLVPADADGKGWVALLLFATAATLAFRRVVPAAAALAAVPFFIVSNALGTDYIDHMVSPFFAAILVLYGIGRHLEGRVVWLLTAYGVAGMWASMAVDKFDDSPGNYIVAAGALIFGPVLLGRVLRHRAGLNRALREKAVRLERCLLYTSPSPRDRS